MTPQLLAKQHPLGVLKRRLYKLLASLEEGIGELVGALKGLGLLNVV
jgi:hypothetical protein